MNCANWWEYYAFCIWDGGFLPSDAEWNYAAAGGSEQRVYPWGSAAPGENANLAVWGCYHTGSGSCTGLTNIAPVGSAGAGNGKYGQADLAGNIWEWNLDSCPHPVGERCYLATSVVTCDDCSYLPSGAQIRAFRGGAFYDVASDMLSAFGTYDTPSNRSDGALGARCARTP
jgi:formylglycine-generating enzyme required for sulfatase activity